MNTYNVCKPPNRLCEEVWRFRALLVQHYLACAGGSVSRAAQLAGMERTNFHRLIHLAKRFR